VYHHWQVLQETKLFAVHLIMISGLTFFTLASLTICVVRDPGPVNVNITRRDDYGGDEDVGLAEALMDDEDFTAPGKWCRKCWVSATRPQVLIWFDLFEDL
jgi:palmitoyltransferase